MRMSKFGYFSEFLLLPLLIFVAALMASRGAAPPEARGLYHRLRRRTHWLDVGRVSAPSCAVSSRACPFPNTRVASSFAARFDRNASLGKRFNWLNRCSASIVAAAWFQRGDRNFRGARYRLSLVCSRSLRGASLAASQRFLFLSGAPAPRATPPSIG